MHLCVIKDNLDTYVFLVLNILNYNLDTYVICQFLIALPFFSSTFNIPCFF